MFVQQFLKDTYWATGRTMTEVQITIDNSFCFGIYLNEKQIGFARVMDVFIVEEYRGKGYSSILINSMTTEPKLKQVKIWRLTTLDAHFLYQKFGFKALENPEKMMEKKII